MKLVMVLYFLTTISGEAVEAFQANTANEVAITAYQSTTFAQAF